MNKTFHFGRNFGLQIETARGSDGKRYLTACIWYPAREQGARGERLLGYFYPSVRWF